MRLIRRKRSRRARVPQQATELARHGRGRRLGLLLVALGAIAAVVRAKARRDRPETPPPVPAGPGPLAGPVRPATEPPSPPRAAAPPPPPPPPPPPAAQAPPPPPPPPAADPPPPPPPPPPPGPEAAAKPGPDDATLARELQAEIGKSGEAPESEIDVTVHDGIAELEGDTRSTEEFRTVFDAAAEVDGVRGVEEPRRPPAERPETDDGPAAA